MGACDWPRLSRSCVADAEPHYRLSIGATGCRRTRLFSNLRRLDACRGNGVHIPDQPIGSSRRIFSPCTARYYYSHWIPPRVDSPEIIGSYSAYGASYLNELDIVYPIAAKVSQLWSVFGLEEATSLRLFNVLLFGGLLGIAASFQMSWPTALVLLLTPQVWYVFSYFNADAFALFLSLVTTMMYAAPNSSVSRFIEGERVSRAVICVFVVALGMLAVSKRNYLPVVFITAFFLTARHLQLTAAKAILGAAGVALLLLKAVAGNALIDMFPRMAPYIAPAGLAGLGVFSIITLWSVLRRAWLRPRLYRLATIFALALAVALPRVIVDIAINGSPSAKSMRMSAVAESAPNCDSSPRPWPPIRRAATRVWPLPQKE